VESSSAIACELMLSIRVRSGMRFLSHRNIGESSARRTREMSRHDRALQEEAFFTSQRFSRMILTGILPQLPELGR
jgi:hypothetical protein